MSPFRLSRRQAIFAPVLGLALVAVSYAVTGVPLSVIAVLILLLMAVGALPFSVGFAVQVALRSRALPLSAIALISLLLALPTWVWDRGIRVTVPGPPQFSQVALFLFLFIFVRNGADAARGRMERRTAKLSARIS